MNVGTGIDIIHYDEEIVEKKIELMNIPEHNLDTGDAYVLLYENQAVPLSK